LAYLPKRFAISLTVTGVVLDIQSTPPLFSLPTFDEASPRKKGEVEITGIEPAKKTACKAANTPNSEPIPISLRSRLPYCLKILSTPDEQDAPVIFNNVASDPAVLNKH
jgi:hypothetical protein